MPARKTNYENPNSKHNYEEKEYPVKPYNGGKEIEYRGVNTAANL